MEDKKKYKCLKPTDGHQIGDIVLMTEAEFNGNNAGELEPRFEPYDEASTESGAEAPATKPKTEEAPAPESANADEEKKESSEPEAPTAPSDEAAQGGDQPQDPTNDKGDEPAA